MTTTKRARFIFLLILFISIAVLSFVMYKIEVHKRQIKEDVIELSKIKYGLFSVDEWKGLIGDIISKKIEAFNLVGANREDMRKKINTSLKVAIHELQKDYYKERSGSFRGFIEGGVASFTGVFDQIEKNIPKFTEQILDFMSSADNRKKIRSFIIKKINEYADETFSEIDYTVHNAILQKYDFGTREQTVLKLNARLAALSRDQRPYSIALAALIAVLGSTLLILSNVRKPEYVLFIATSFTLLISGLLLPMIEIDARISSVSFSLLGETVKFEDQVLYYKSKSILEVVQLMMVQNRVDLILVGLLVLAFSVLFPLTKLICTIAFMGAPQLRSNKFVNFMIFKSGKWSMADVMVIAIFMAYIGFSGIITEQLNQLKSITENIDLLTTNKSSLLSGFYLFTGFTLVSLLISQKLQDHFFSVPRNSPDR